MGRVRNGLVVGPSFGVDLWDLVVEVELLAVENDAKR